MQDRIDVIGTIVLLGLLAGIAVLLPLALRERNQKHRAAVRSARFSVGSRVRSTVDGAPGVITAVYAGDAGDTCYSVRVSNRRRAAGYTERWYVKEYELELNQGVPAREGAR